MRSAASAPRPDAGDPVTTVRHRFRFSPAATPTSTRAAYADPMEDDSTVPVRYHCPHCGTVVALPRDPYLDDRSVTPYPLEGWTYVSPTEEYEADGADGVRFVCGRDEGGTEWDGEGCGEPFYLSFVRYEDGVAVEPPRESEYVELAGEGPGGPRGPRGPGGPGR